MRRLERGASYVPLIIVIVLLIVAVVWAWVKTDEADELKQQLATETEKAASTQKRLGDVKNYLVNRIAPGTGFPIEPPGTEEEKPDYGVSASRIRAFVNQKLDDMKKKYVRTFPLAVYSENPNGGIKREETGEEITVEYVQTGRIGEEETLESIYRLMSSAIDRMLVDLNGFATRLDQKYAEAAQNKKAFDGTIGEKDAEIARKTKEYNDFQTRAQNERNDLAEQLSAAEKEKRDAQQALENLQKQKKEEIASLKNEVLSLEQHVRQLKERQKPRILRPGPDGEVLAASDTAGTVVLNRGKADRMMPGLTFTVYTYGKGGRKVMKGQVTVLDVADKTATATIVELLSPMHPIVRGDMFESVVYDKDEVVHFFLLGRFRKYGRSDAATRLRQLGAQVDTKVGIDTDYVVLGEPAAKDENLRETDAYKQAVELGIAVITEKQLSMFLRY